MSTELMDPETIEQLSTKLIAQLRAPLDKRDSDLCEKLAKQIDEKISAALKEEERKRAQFAVPGLGKEETKKFQFHKLIQAKLTGNHKLAEYELEVCRAAAAIQNKDMTAGTDAAGGFLIPNEVLVNELIPLLKEEAICFKLGAMSWNDLKNSPVQIPKKTGASTLTWVGEAPAAGVPKSELTFGPIEMNPHTAAIRVGISNRLIMQSGSAVEALVRADISEEMALGVDNVYFNGTGVSNQPKGILQASGIKTVATFGAADGIQVYDKLIDMLYELRKQKIRGPFAWAMHPAVLREFQQQKDQNDATLGDQPKSRRLFDALPISTKLLGWPFETSMTIPTNDILLGQYSFAGVGFWSTMQIRMSDIPGWANLVTEIMATIDIDVGIRREEAFCHTTGMTGATA
jgi:HK97 family phage major capsid protein